MPQPKFSTPIMPRTEFFMDAAEHDEWDELLDRIDWYFTAAEQVLIVVFMAAFAGLLFYNLILWPLHARSLQASDGWSPWRPAFQS